MKKRFRLIIYRSLGGVIYIHDNETDLRISLETKDKARAVELLMAKNESAREPAFNLLKARVYMAMSPLRLHPETGIRPIFVLRTRPTIS